MDSLFFYNNLFSHEKSVNDLLCRPDIFRQIPKDWQVIVTDIKGSTEAVKSGLFEMVNLIATGSIIAALNIASKSKVDIPFFFGGDGATLLVPPSLLAEIIVALIQHQNNVKREFNIDLRVGNLPVSTVYENGCELKIAKVSINPLYTIPIILGAGLYYAEELIKQEDITFRKESNEIGKLNLEGMECRWNNIPPPKGKDEVVCLLISTVKESEQAKIFKKILDKADEIYGSHKKRNPISLTKLQLNTGLRKIKGELKIRQPNFSILGLIKNWIYVILGKYWYLKSDPGKKYLNQLIQLSDIFVLDGRINMVISSRKIQRETLIIFLDYLEKKGDIFYGIYVSSQSIISCYVRNRDTNHIHFIDGSGGGYTQAAIMLKEKMKRKDSLRVD